MTASRAARAWEERVAREHYAPIYLRVLACPFGFIGAYKSSFIHTEHVGKRQEVYLCLPLFSVALI